MALHRLLTQLGVDPVAIPHELEERAALWRAETAGRRAVVLLDNAATVQQVRPLLPGGGSCSVVITSRRRLVGLEGAEILSMRVMTVPDAVELFDRIAGLDRTAGERDAVVEAVGLCGFLPLAIDYFLQAHALTMIGDTRLAMGEPSVAKDLWQQALVILDNLAHRDAAGVRERLRALES
ncbi:hypothetical protein [Actinospica sp.]|uniref:hypothetical protein n=1 Tax=Actinospica sp. TaxID=1872142 RepID=UPI002CD14616|nr:hypothetical protein [Actinospica sp.]HWG25603.1 hypothetical protein [Actinospica sp.]